MCEPGLWGPWHMACSWARGSRGRLILHPPSLSPLTPCLSGALISPTISHPEPHPPLQVAIELRAKEKGQGSAPLDVTTGFIGAQGPGLGLGPGLVW